MLICFNNAVKWLYIARYNTCYCIYIILDTAYIIHVNAYILCLWIELNTYKCIYVLHICVTYICLYLLVVFNDTCTRLYNTCTDIYVLLVPAYIILVPAYVIHVPAQVMLVNAYIPHVTKYLMLEDA